MSLPYIFALENLFSTAFFFLSTRHTFICIFFHRRKFHHFISLGFELLFYHRKNSAPEVRLLCARIHFFSFLFRLIFPFVHSISFLVFQMNGITNRSTCTLFSSSSSLLRRLGLCRSTALYKWITPKWDANAKRIMWLIKRAAAVKKVESHNWIEWIPISLIFNGRSYLSLMHRFGFRCKHVYFEQRAFIFLFCWCIYFIFKSLRYANRKEV